MDKKSIMMIVAVAGGGYLAYWILTKYGSAGAVQDANGNPIAGRVSYWDSLFGTTAAVAAPAQTSAPSTTTGTPAGTSTNPPAGGNGTSIVPTATPDQISKLRTLIQSSDQAAFTQMLPITAAQASQMLANAQACGAGIYHPDSGGGQCVTPTVTPLPSAPGGSRTDTSLRGLLLQASGGTNNLSVSQWNWYLNNGLGGTIQPNGQVLIIGDGTQMMDVDTYLSLRASHGLSGMGMIMASPPVASLPIPIAGMSGVPRPAVRTRSPWGNMSTRSIN